MLELHLQVGVEDLVLRPLHVRDLQVHAYAGDETGEVVRVVGQGSLVDRRKRDLQVCKGNQHLAVLS